MGPVVPGSRPLRALVTAAVCVSAAVGVSTQVPAIDALRIGVSGCALAMPGSARSRAAYRSARSPRGTATVRKRRPPMVAT